MSKGDLADLQQTYDALAAWLRDCVRKRDFVGVRHAQGRMKELESLLKEV